MCVQVVTLRCALYASTFALFILHNTLPTNRGEECPIDTLDLYYLQRRMSNLVFLDVSSGTKSQLLSLSDSLRAHAEVEAQRYINRGACIQVSEFP